MDWQPEAGLGVVQRIWLNLLNLKIETYITLTWPQNARNPICEDLSFKDFTGEDAFASPYRRSPLASLSKTCFYKTLYPPQMGKLCHSTNYPLNKSSSEYSVSVDTFYTCICYRSKLIPLSLNPTYSLIMNN